MFANPCRPNARTEEGKFASKAANFVVVAEFVGSVMNCGPACVFCCVSPIMCGCCVCCSMIASGCTGVLASIDASSFIRKSIDSADFVLLGWSGVVTLAFRGVLLIVFGALLGTLPGELHSYHDCVRANVTEVGSSDAFGGGSQIGDDDLAQFLNHHNITLPQGDDVAGASLPRGMQRCGEIYLDGRTRDQHVALIGLAEFALTATFILLTTSVVAIVAGFSGSRAERAEEIARGATSRTIVEAISLGKLGYAQAAQGSGCGAVPEETAAHVAVVVQPEAEPSGTHIGVL